VTFLYVALAAAVGAPLRYVVDQLVQDRFQGAFPLGTFIVNMSGSLLLGLLTGLADGHGAPPVAAMVAGTGLLGGYTTFSTFTWESLQLFEEGALWEAGLNVAGSLITGLLAGAAGLALGLGLG
jgi:CrcB protein